MVVRLRHLISVDEARNSSPIAPRDALAPRLVLPGLLAMLFGSVLIGTLLLAPLDSVLAQGLAPGNVPGAEAHATARTGLPRIELVSPDELEVPALAIRAPGDEEIAPRPVPAECVPCAELDRAPDLPGPACIEAGGPCLSEVRAFQVGYSDAGGQLSLTWQTLGERLFDHFFICVEGRGVARVDGAIQSAGGVELPPLPPGPTRIVVAGCHEGRLVSRSLAFDVRRRSPVPSVKISDWFSYGFLPGQERGVLELELAVDGPDPRNVRLDLEIRINGEFRGLLRDTLLRRITINNLHPRRDPEFYEIEVVPFLGPYASEEPPSIRAEARTLHPPGSAHCEFVDCSNGTPRFEISLEMPRRTPYERVLLWIEEDGNPLRWRPLELVPLVVEGPGEDGNFLKARLRVPGGVPVGTRLYLSGAQLGNQSPRPRFLSNVPWSNVSRETVVECSAPDDGCNVLDRPRFRRGDANNNSSVDISDAIGILSFLFLGTFEPTCPDALDVGDDGKIDISDPVRLLGFLFTGAQPPPPPPGPRDCGVDPSDDDLPDCRQRSCAAGIRG